MQVHPSVSTALIVTAVQFPLAVSMNMYMVMHACTT